MPPVWQGACDALAGLPGHCRRPAHGVECRQPPFLPGTLVDTIKILFQRLLLALILIGAVWFCQSNPDMVGQALRLPISNLLLILCGYLACHMLNAAMVAGMLRRRGIVVPLGQLLVLNANAALRGYSTLLRGGLHQGTAKLYRQYCHVPMTLSLGVMAFLSLVLIFTVSGLGLLAGIWGHLWGGQMIPPLYWLVLGSALVLCVTIVLGIHKLGGVDKLPRILQVWVANLYAVFNGTRAGEVVKVMGLVLLGLLPQVLIFAALFNSFNQDVTIFYLMFTAIFASLALVVNLTPGNLGLRELIILLMIAHLDISVSGVVALLIVDRLLQLLLLLALGLGGHHTLKSGSSAAPATAG